MSSTPIFARHISKLRALGILDLLAWLVSFITNRKQLLSSIMLTLKYLYIRGFPHVGPLLFNLFVSHISEAFQFCKYLMYADDLYNNDLYKNVSFCYYFSFMNLIQNDLTKLEVWRKSNRLLLNFNKCRVIRFNCKTNSKIFNYSLGGTILNR